MTRLICSVGCNQPNSMFLIANWSWDAQHENDAKINGKDQIDGILGSIWTTICKFVLSMFQKKALDQETPKQEVLLFLLSLHKNKNCDKKQR